MAGMGQGGVQMEKREEQPWGTPTPRGGYQPGGRKRLLVRAGIWAPRTQKGRDQNPMEIAQGEVSTWASVTAEGPGWEASGGRWYHPDVTLKETKAQRGKG